MGLKVLFKKLEILSNIRQNNIENYTIAYASNKNFVICNKNCEILNYNYPQPLPKAINL